MAQTIYHNYKDALTSNGLNRVLLGVLEPGRFRGFDTMNVTVLAFTLSHEVTGIVQTRENLSQTNPTGVLLTKQGFICQEDAAITALACATNAANAFTRIDLVVFTHEDVNVPGGQAGVYSVIQGANGGPVVPSLPNPEKQIIIGQISIPPSVSNLTTATWTPTAAPLLGGQNFLTNFPEIDARYAKLGTGGPNAYTTQNRNNYDTPLMVITSNKWTPSNTANTYSSPVASSVLNEIQGVRKGTRLRIIANGQLTINLNVSPVSGGQLIGQPTLSILLGVTSIVLLAGQSIDIEDISTGWLIVSLPDTILTRILNIETDVTPLKTLQGFVHAEAASDYNGGASVGTQKILFDTEISDTNNWFVPGATSRFTPLKAGNYKFNVMVALSKLQTEPNNIKLHIFKNGVSQHELYTVAGYVGSSAVLCLNGSLILSANGSTDYFEVFIVTVGTAPSGGYDFYSGSNLQTEFLGT